MNNGGEATAISFFFINTGECLFKGIGEIKKIISEVNRIKEVNFSAFFHSGEKNTEWVIKIARSGILFENETLFSDSELSCTREWMEKIFKANNDGIEKAVLAAVPYIKDASGKTIPLPQFHIVRYKMIGGEKLEFENI